MNSITFPPQQLSFRKKNAEWRKRVVDWAAQRTFYNYSPVRNSIIHKKINYDLTKGKLHMKDLQLILNPDNIDASFIPDNIQHYNIMLPKLNVLRGEELARVFDYKVVVTNPNAISEIEENKKQELMTRMQQVIENEAQSQEDYEASMQKLSDYFKYQWQDMREIRANALLNHYMKEYNMPLMFNTGFVDAETVGEEIYQVDIIGGEPTVERIDPQDIRVFQSGQSNKIEDADMVIIEQKWSIGKIFDVYYQSLTEKDRKYLEGLISQGGHKTDAMQNIDPREGLVNPNLIEEDDFGFQSDGYIALGDQILHKDVLPTNMFGDITVLRVYWKSRRKIKKVKSYDPETGEEVYNLYPETYVIDKDLGEEEEIYWVNEAWEGTKIGDDIYVCMRPRVVQYNRMSNPSRCHFGIIGTVYNITGGKPLSLVDIMKPYNYLYDAIHDRLNKLMASNWGKIVRLDLAKVPPGWDIDKWMYYAKTNHLAVEDSFKEGNIGMATGKLAGGMNNASSGVIDADFGNNIQQYINLLEFIKMEMSEVCGVNAQREGQISNRETVGGVERATLQSSHITEWLFAIHEDIKKRVMEAFLETAKIALKGGSAKFNYILADGSLQIIEVDGDEFAECDYGLVVDNSQGTQKLQQSIETLAQAALQTQTLSFSTIMKLFSSSSIIEKMRLVEADEQKMQEMQQQQQQQQLQAQQQAQELQAQMAQQQQELQYRMNQENNETKIMVAEINSQAEAQRFAMMNNDDGIEEPIYSEQAKAELKEKMRQFDKKLQLEKQKMELDKKKHEDTMNFNKQKLQTDASLKRKQINKHSSQ